VRATDRFAEETPISRRELVGTIGLGASGALSGCARKDGQSRAESEPDGTTPETAEDPATEDGFIGETMSELRTSYERLDRVPIAEDGSFVFETDRFIDEFEDGSGIAISETPSERFRDRSESELSERKAKGLAAAADLSVWLFNQRLHLFDTIVSGERFLQSDEGEYEPAIEHLRNGLQALRALPKNRERVRVSLSHVRETGVAIDGYDLETVPPANELTGKVASWARPAYEGLFHTLRGFSLIESIEPSGDSSELFPYRKRDYERLAAEFRTAEASFTHAHGQGRRLRYLSETVDSHRCAASTLREGFEDAVRGKRKLNTGTVSEAERIATEVEERFVRGTVRCSEL